MPGDLCAPAASVVPGADGEQCIADAMGIAVGKHVVVPGSGDPPGREFTPCIATVEVVISRTDQQGRPVTNATKILLHDDRLSRPMALNVQRHKRVNEPFYQPVYDDPRVTARLAVLDKEFEQLREEIGELMLEPEWNQ